MSGATTTGPITVQCMAGTSGATYDGTLGTGGAIQHILGAQDGQFLKVDVRPRSPAMDFAIRNPNGSALLDMNSSDRPNEGQFFQIGDHVVEIVDRIGKPQAYLVEFSIR